MENQAPVKSVGTILREARLAKGLTLADVEKATNIREQLLVYLETEEFEKTPGEFFVKGAIRTYGNFLELNGPELVDLYKASQAGKQLHEVEAHGIREAKNVTMKLQLKDKRDIGSGNGKLEINLPWKQIAMGVAGLAVMGVLYFAVPAVINWVSTVSVNVPKVSPAPHKISDNQEKAQSKPVPDKLVMELQASGKCWLEVSADGEKIAETMLYEGDKKTYEAKDKLIAKFGNIGAVQVKLNGELQNIVGEQGVAVKTYTREPVQENKQDEAKEKQDEKPKDESSAKIDEQPKDEPSSKSDEQSKVESSTKIEENSQADTSVKEAEQPKAEASTKVVEQPQAEPSNKVEEQPKANSNIKAEKRSKSKANSKDTKNN